MDRLAPPGTPRQRTLLVRLLQPGLVLAPAQIIIDGGERIRRVGVIWAAPADALPAVPQPPETTAPAADPAFVAAVAMMADDPARTLVIRTDSDGDHSTYTLRLISAPGSSEPPAGVDPVLARVDFSFKVECPNAFDCTEARPCPPPPTVRGSARPSCWCGWTGRPWR